MMFTMIGLYVLMCGPWDFMVDSQRNNVKLLYNIFISKLNLWILSEFLVDKSRVKDRGNEPKRQKIFVE